ncbi:phage protein NinX family protein [Stutzerimonas nitrititolerans]|uniref:phage protein NinX family protein n=1 Tax=Stutzerimonas nitrititolerans TaxID=2482751 RepID=UPI0028ACE156|nr:phage protein NinX family protein [Stutzerimonas nitrititolerans]
MREMKTAELIGPALDWATFCAVYPGVQPTINIIPASSVERKPFFKPIQFPKAVYLSYSGAYDAEIRWSPSADWEQGGPLIHKYGCDLNCIALANCWESNCWDDDLPTPDLHLMEGETPLIAACRAIVRAKIGRTVQVPDDLA